MTEGTDSTILAIQSSEFLQVEPPCLYRCLLLQWNSLLCPLSLCSCCCVGWNPIPPNNASLKKNRTLVSVLIGWCVFLCREMSLFAKTVGIEYLTESLGCWYSARLLHWKRTSQMTMTLLFIVTYPHTLRVTLKTQLCTDPLIWTGDCTQDVRNTISIKFS